ncbi:unnamed protein product [Spirodela intermedia]|uniref:BHLH domain-containing protein n=1 Tax=Spirodela intermedia TaxID=51605 RepID=A0A7I8IPQ7_SPIIN|nr:unnamed protein product [Spirodela intermedia]CAA6659860.1 unnamed protein product [Spirodela intermedia]
MEEKIFECPPQISSGGGGWGRRSAAALHGLLSFLHQPGAVGGGKSRHPRADRPAGEHLQLRRDLAAVPPLRRRRRHLLLQHPPELPPKLNLSTMVDHLPRLGNSAPPPPLTTHLTAFAADPEFAERAARLSCFGGRCYGSQIGLSRVSSSQSLMAAPPDGSQLEVDMRSRLSSTRLSRSSTPDDAEFGGAREEEPPPAPVVQQSSRARNDGGAGRKRKTAPRGKAKQVRGVCRRGEDDVQPQQPKAEPNSDSGDDKGSNSKSPAEPPKQDYIHVRARRGQATDSHSLAERVRREKISQRMKFLQDLVPGCNKVTGKALMLDEIINYVQSLQRQVEFLSMKLATVNPRLDFNVESLLPKGMNQPRGSLPHSVFPPPETTSSAFSFAQQETALQSIITGGGLESHSPMNHHHHQHHHPLAGFMDASSQLMTFWEDDLHSVVQMGAVQNQEAALSSQSFPSMAATHMTIQL